MTPSRLSVLLATVFIAAFAIVTRLWWVPVQDITDANAYLVGAKQIVETGSPAVTARNPATGKPDPFEFVGQMWVSGSADLAAQRFYPKYPLGTSLVFAALMRLGGAAHGQQLAYLAPALLMAGGLLAAFFFMRQWMGPWSALECLVVLASSPTIIREIRCDKSHGLSLLIVSGGLYLLVNWWRSGGWTKAAAAGFVIGCATVVRYSDGLFVLPVLAVLCFRFPKTQEDRRRWAIESGVLLGLWAVPLLLQIAFNLASCGLITGYDATGESTNFSLHYLVLYWRHTCRHLFMFGLTLCIPLGLLGMIVACFRNWKTGIFLLLCAMPTVALYAAYWWHQAEYSAGFARFFTAVLPIFLIATILLIYGKENDSHAKIHRTRRALLALVLAGTAIWNTCNAIGPTRQEYLTRLNLAYQASVLDQEAPAESVIIGPGPLLNHLQFVSDDYYLIRHEIFRRDQLTNTFDGPEARWGWRLRYRTAMGSLSAEQRAAALREYLKTLLKSGRRVFLIGSDDPADLVFDNSFKIETVLQENEATRFPPNLPTLLWHPKSAFGHWQEVADGERAGLSVKSPFLHEDKSYGLMKSELIACIG